ncbi:PEP-CTERM sorting domain-containing protein [Aeoliella mucimassa]|uniref:PEP-CTERM motif protein n=1 Tax=Aeoliella mucimassa TaxID=2527972 RepID=A0A518AQT0_9BACT|nr:PEP-CTERM sorting domain-containing protein [Aeoliella mucimassa]QDU57065.1 PEP-CTERM motif protein [Aeoliella mucimassa]
MSWSFRPVLALVAGLLALAAVPASAFELTQSYTISPQTLAGPSDTALNGVPFSLSVDVDQFDPALGALTSVVVDFDMDYLLEGTTTTGGSLSGSVGGTLYWDSQAFGGGGNGIGGGGGPGPLLLPFEVAGVAGGPSFNTAWAIGTGTSLLEYTGTANVTPTGFEGNTLGLAAGTFEVTYTYVPEPSTVLLLVGGLGAVAFAARRR